MRKRLFYQALLLGAMATMSACSNGDFALTETPPPDLSVWTAVANNATQGDIVVEDSVETRALFIGGYTDRFLSAWDDGDKVKVYKDTKEVGEMTPESAYYGTKTATLTGTLTGPFAKDEELTLYLPDKAMDFTGQTGTLQSVSKKSFQTQTVTIAEAADNLLTLSDVTMSHRQTYVRFFLTDAEDGSRLHPSQLVIHPVSGGSAVLKMDADGNVTEKGDIVLNMVQNRGEYPGEIYVAILNEGDATVTYSFKAKVGDDIYVGPISGSGAGYGAYGPALGSFKGTLRGAERKLLKTTPVSSLTVETIPNQAYTGSAIEPAVVVKDGETVLTEGTDYSVSYSDNTEVGEATVTITGLADAGALAATKYLGTKQVTFSIVNNPVGINSTISGYGSGSSTGGTVTF